MSEKLRIDWPQPGRLEQTREYLASIEHKNPLSEDDLNMLHLAAGWGVYEIDRLLEILGRKLHERRCYNCGYVGWYSDCIAPACLCDKCGSQDTRRLKK